MSRTRILLGVWVAVLFAVQTGLGEDMLSGTWKINLAKSKYSPANLTPQNGMTTIEAIEGGVKSTLSGIDSQGRKTANAYTVKFDGKIVQAMATVDGKPSPDQDGTSWKKIDDYTFEVTATLKGKPTTITRIVVAKDGKSRKSTITGKNAQGTTVNNIVVYEKQ